MFKVVFCGDAAVGKTTLIMRLCKGKFIPSISTTLGVDFQNKQIEFNGKRVALQLWDTAGQERFNMNYFFLLFFLLNKYFFLLKIS
jgi:Ras and EF-hand domain-containing protein